MKYKSIDKSKDKNQNKKKNKNYPGGHFLPSKYLLRGFYDSGRFNIVLPFLICLSAAAAGLLAMYLPKIVLDAVERGAAAHQLFLQTGAVGVLLAGTSLAAMVLRNELELASQSFLYTELTARWERGMLRMDYEAFVSERGKLLAEKARNAISSPNWGAVKFLPGLTAILEALAGLLVCCGIVGTLHPAIVLFLLLLFGVQLWFSARMQKGKQKLKEERAAADRRLNYLAWGMRGRKEGKDIRLYSFDVLLHRIAQRTIADKRAVEGKAEKLQFCNMLFAALLLLLRDGTAYFYLIWRFLHSGMTLGDFTLYFAAITGVGGGLLKLAQAVSDFLETGRYAGDFFEFMQYSMGGAEEKGESRRGLFYSSESETGADVSEGISFTFENVSFSYYAEQNGEKQEIPVIRNLNLTISAGESVAVVGVNGAGKSTFVKLLCGLLTPCEGRILVNGRDSRLFCREDYFGLFSAVFQKSGFLPVSIAENIMLNVKRKSNGNSSAAERSIAVRSAAESSTAEKSAVCRSAADRSITEKSAVYRSAAESSTADLRLERQEAGPEKSSGAHGDKEPECRTELFSDCGADGAHRDKDAEVMWECLRRAGLEEKVKALPQGADTCLVKRIAQDGTELSGGQEQKLLLARALYKDAPVLILDEPTAALDPVSEHAVYLDYRRMTEGKTSVFISHRLASTRFCDRILLFSDGRIAESGTHEELLALGGQYAEMFEVQSRYYRDAETGERMEDREEKEGIKGWAEEETGKEKGETARNQGGLGE